MEKLTEENYQAEIVRLHGLCDLQITALRSARRLLKLSGFNVTFIDDLLGSEESDAERILALPEFQRHPDESQSDFRKRVMKARGIKDAE